jgi:hypothetical protein
MEVNFVNTKENDVNIKDIEESAIETCFRELFDIDIGGSVDIF